MGRFSGDKVPVRFSVGSGLPSGYGGTDFESENIYSVLGPSGMMATPDMGKRFR